MAKFATVTRSHVAGVSVDKTLRAKMEMASSSWMTKALLVCSITAGFALTALPFIGGAASFGIDRYRNRYIEQKQKDVLADYYRNQVAMQLGIDPNSVKVSDLELAAKVNPMIAGAINKVNAEKKSANRSAAFISAGVATVGYMPGVNAFTNAAAKMGGATLGGVAHVATHIGSGVAGGVASSLFDKNVLEVHDMVEVIDEKRNTGQTITATDVALLLIAKDAKLQKAIKDHYKKPLHQMSELEQQHVMEQMPGLLQESQQKAGALNDGLISVQNIVAAGPESTSSFAQNIQRKAAPGSYTAMIAEQQRAAQLPNVAEL